MTHIEQDRPASLQRWIGGCACLALLGLAAWPLPAQAQTATDATRTVVVRRVNLHPSSAAAARRTLARLDEAALAACGASGFSLREARQAVRASSCWHDAMADVLGRIGDPALTAVYHRAEAQL